MANIQGMDQPDKAQSNGPNFRGSRGAQQDRSRLPAQSVRSTTNCPFLRRDWLIGQKFR